MAATLAAPKAQATPLATEPSSAIKALNTSSTSNALSTFNAHSAFNTHNTHNAFNASSTLTADGNLPRGKASKKLRKAMTQYMQALTDSSQNVESIMVVQHGKVVAEHWRGQGKADVPHELWSVSKCFTSAAVGFAINEGKLRLDDKVVAFFPDLLPDTASANLSQMTVRHLLTMTCGHRTEVQTPWSEQANTHNWVRDFLAAPVPCTPGTHFRYNSVGTYMLSAIVQKVTGQKLVDYLTPRLFQPLHIVGARWEESPQGINCGGWGLWLKTEDLAKMGLFMLQKGRWNGRQLLPAAWYDEASSAIVLPAGATPQPGQAVHSANSRRPDWTQGYGYQLWRCRHNSYRADGSYGQYILVIPDKDAVIAVTAHLDDMQAELNLIWQYVWTAL